MPHKQTTPRPQSTYDEYEDDRIQVTNSTATEEYEDLVWMIITSHATNFLRVHRQMTPRILLYWRGIMMRHKDLHKERLQPPSFHHSTRYQVDTRITVHVKNISENTTLD